MGGGLLDFIATNWIPLGQNHWMTYVAQVIIGLIFQQFTSLYLDILF